MYSNDSSSLMDLVIVLQLVNFICLLGVLAVGVGVLKALIARNSNTQDDPTGEKKQKIFDTLSKVNDGIKKIV